MGLALMSFSRVPTKYLLRLQGEGQLCGLCSLDCVGALIDPETNDSLPVCDEHCDEEIANECGLNVVRFAGRVEGDTNA